MEIKNLVMNQSSVMFDVANALAFKLNKLGYSVKKIRIGDGAQFIDVHVFCDNADIVVTEKNLPKIMRDTLNLIADFNTAPPKFIDDNDKVGIQQIQSQVLRAYSFCNGNWMDMLKV